ncbi:MAG: hypothetical protein LBQ50_03330 [Planctomycetaceae bacterium]|jgi:hypothetical protein|nr:hypothetical protein [Planctomycetaceae bacterium]
MKKLTISILFFVLFLFVSNLYAGGLTIQLSGEYDDVTFVGAIYRWDSDGLPRQADGSARVAKERAEAPKINEPWVDYRARNKGNGTWVIESLLPGIYDLIIVKNGTKQRFEGWRYAPVLDFEEFFPPNAEVLHDQDNDGKKETVKDEESRKFVDKTIRESKHYENKVIPLYFGGSYKKGQIRPKQIRVLVMLLRDLVTTLDSSSATLRFEIWQFEDRSGGYVKQKRTHVLHRIIMPRNELRQWAWLWDPALGNISVGESDQKTIEYKIPDPSDTKLQGLLPY